jgi:signal transduction histidine kinase
MKTRARSVLITLGIWSLVAAVFIGGNIANDLARGRPVLARRDVYDEALYWAAFALLTPAFLWLCARFPLTGRGRWRSFPVHFVAAPVLATLQVFLYWGIRSLIDLGRTDFVPAAVTAYWKYWVIMGLLHGVAYARLYAREQRAAAELRAQLTTAQLDRLKAQLQPHFLFNTLNSIAVLMQDDVPRARAMLLRLSDMLRAVVTSSGEQLVPLARELAFIGQYLDIQQMRFGERLEVGMDIGVDPERELVPHFLIQPLVENAVQHGIAPAEQGGTVTVRARRDPGQLCIEVTDVPRVPAGRGADEAGPGVGLSNPRDRLAALYGGRAKLTITPVGGGGTRVRVSLPAPGEEAADGG